MYLVKFFIILYYFTQPSYVSTGKHHIKCGQPLGSDFILQSERIVAGYDLGYYRYPWYAALIRSNQVNCGGALIGPRTVLTAAHCFKSEMEQVNVTKLEDVYTVRLGLYNICISEKTVMEFKVEKVQVHELYKTKKPYYDICLITLANNTDKYHPICLPSAALSKRPREGTVPGMGTLKYQGPMPCTLHEARILIYPDDECRKMIHDTGNNESEITNAFCAGYMTGGTDTCQGDSGGPLQIVDDNGNYILLGIVSFGFHCAVPGYLGMYTDISQYLKWIHEKSQLDLDFIHSLHHHENNGSEEIYEIPSDDHKHKKHYHYGKPYRRPITIIILKDNKLVSVRQPIIHYPIKKK